MLPVGHEQLHPEAGRSAKVSGHRSQFRDLLAARQSAAPNRSICRARSRSAHMKSPVVPLESEAPLTNATTPLRLLLVEHSSHDIELILFELRDSGFRIEPTVVETRAEFLRALKNGAF